MKRVALVTAVPFWRTGNGSASRTHELCRYLSERVHLAVVGFGETVSEPDLEKIRAVSASFDLVETGKGKALPLVYRAVQRILAARDPNACIVDRLINAWVIPALDKRVRRIVDTHDLMSAHLASARKYGIDSSLDPIFMPLSFEQEMRLLAKFDVAMFIRQDECDLASAMIGKERCIVVPHPAVLRRRTLRPTVSHIGLVSSGWATNVEGIKWFANEVWPVVKQPGITLDIFGPLCAALEDDTIEQCTLHGFVDDISLAYDRLDIVINPARAGSGLKIKSVEALGCGLPLVTTSEGAGGLQELAGRGLLVADAADEFADHLRLLIADHALRLQLGDAAFAFAAARLSPDKCFAPLLDAIGA